MRMHKTAHGHDFDLDDPETYIMFPQDVSDVLTELWRRIGFVKIYLVAHDWANVCKRQVDDIEAFERGLVPHFNSSMYSKPLAFWQERLFLYQDLTENLC